MTLDDLYRMIKDNTEMTLNKYPDLVEFTASEEQLESMKDDDYMALVWFFGQPRLERLYFDGYDFYYTDGQFRTREKVSHYIPNQPERSKRENSHCEMRCSEHCGNTMSEAK